MAGVVTECHDAVPGPASAWACAVCGAHRPIEERQPWRCPNATGADRRHVLHPTFEDWSSDPAPAWTADGINPYVANDGRMTWAGVAAARGVGTTERRALIERLDESLLAFGDPAFVPTPLERSSSISDELGFSRDGGIWIKDETGNVGGSHKARHLQAILLHLLAADITDGVLAIASCGNAAIAAATLARAARRPLDVYVPTWMDDATGAQLERLGARITRCGRDAADPPGDPAMLRFREAVDAGAVPFTVQGPENALCLDGGRTLGWEVIDQVGAAGERPFDRVFAQVGGGAFAADLGAAMCSPGGVTRLHAVQAAGCAPLDRAWHRMADRGVAVGDLGAHWAELMEPWDQPHSIADGILDDETYDWLDVIGPMAASGGHPVVVTETQLSEAHRTALGAGVSASPTGTAGLAGVLAMRRTISADERILVVATGTAR